MNQIKSKNINNFICKVTVNNNLLSSLVNIQRKSNPNDQKYDLLNLEKFKKFVKNCEKKLKSKKTKVLIISFNSNKKYKIDHLLMRNITEIASSFLGNLVSQNKHGEKNVVVYDRGRNLSIKNGARYHQTREGGSIHTDNVNVSSRWKYMILSCLAEGQVGGETILVNGNDVYNQLKKNYKEAKRILQKKFFGKKEEFLNHSIQLQSCK